MDYKANAFNLLISFAMLQGFIFGILLCYKSSYKGAQKYLGLTVIFLSFYLLWVLKYDFGLQERFPKLQFLPILFLWGIGPAFYVYLKLLLKDDIESKKLKLYFLPLLLEFLYINSSTFILWLNDMNYTSLGPIAKIYVLNVFNIDHIVGIILLGYFIYKSYLLTKEKLLLFAANKIRTILWLFIILWLIWMPYTVIDVFSYNLNIPPSSFYFFYTFLAILTYCIGFYGFRINDNTLPEIITNGIVSSSPNTIPDIEAEAILEKINKVMIQEKRFLDPELNLDKFSKYLGAHPNKVSAILNNKLDYSFRDFINFYRINEFKAKSKTYDFKNNTIYGLAYDSGFNSKASFNRAFNKICGVTPSEYLKKSIP